MTERARAIAAHLMQRFCELYPHRTWRGECEAIDRMAAEIRELRGSCCGRRRRREREYFY